MTQLYCKGGIVIATHDERLNVPPSAYGAGVTAMIGEAAVGDPAPSPDPVADARAALAASDAGMGRVVEEIAALLAAGDAKLAGLSVAAKARIAARAASRATLATTTHS